MTESELTFLALGVMLGAAGGAALVTVLGNGLPRREVRVTVTRDAVPRRSPTLAIDAFVTRPAEPAPGGPGDRRILERPPSDEPVGGPGVPVGPGPRVAPAATAGRDPGGADIRTLVRSGPPDPQPSGALALPDGAAVASHIADAPDLAPIGVATDSPAAPATGPAILRILRGDHQAMLELVDALAGAEGRRRREWEVLLTGLGQAISETAIDEGVLDFPMGTPLWDAFTVEQCREIAAALASMGYRFDGRDGWADGRAPGYRELSQALADIGVDPIRIRIWPNSSEIAELLRGARAAGDVLVARDAPDLQLDDVRELTRWHAESLAGLWLAWETVRPLLLADGAEEPNPA
ncbi:MAG TPA: hypothetical protein VK831_07745 [Candidatus Deferrimicrobiaceae bacterium]|nr:hypothetical protein [Candidatus Deferrimicrobiaceae bacterium]